MRKLMSLPAALRSVDATDVCFSLPSDAPLIEHFDLHVQPGQRIAIVGPYRLRQNHAHQSAMRFYDVQQGAD